MTRHQLVGWVGVMGVLIAFNIGTAFWGSRNLSSAADIKRIQYKVVEVTSDALTLQATLDTYGRAGWDLVTVALGDIQSPKLILKKSE
ncbi:MAG: hypothetical protein OJF52_001076 [Nitrospira sp.]|jgi:hypothetical protein|nr:MAG: hypothetical protein OJF52_001076 [Nitrospira sp.]